MVWDLATHHETTHALGDIALNRENRVVIITGTGDEFIARHEFGDSGEIPAAVWHEVMSDARHLIMNHLDIEVPMIAAVNGPALIHAELALLCDVVLAADAEFQDLPHFTSSLVPVDGGHVVFPCC